MTPRELNSKISRFISRDTELTKESVLFFNQFSWGEFNDVDPSLKRLLAAARNAVQTYRLILDEIEERIDISQFLIEAEENEYNTIQADLIQRFAQPESPCRLYDRDGDKELLKG